MIIEIHYDSSKNICMLLFKNSKNILEQSMNAVDICTKLCTSQLGRQIISVSFSLTNIRLNYLSSAYQWLCAVHRGNQVLQSLGGHGQNRRQNNHTQRLQR